MATATCSSTTWSRIACLNSSRRSRRRRRRAAVTADVVFGQGGDFVSNAPNGDASPTNQTLYGPLSVMVDGSNALYISDTNNSRILAYPTPYKPPGTEDTPPPAGVLSVSAASLRFDATAVGKSRTREVTLSNAGATQIAL